MCGRYSITSNFEAVRRLFNLTGPVPNWWQPLYNIAPTEEAPVVRLRDGQPELVPLRWGLIPFWAKDEKFGHKTINAKAETVATAPAFREAFAARRCLVVTDGFYEWQKEGAAKQPWRIGMQHRGPFGLAGLWERWGPREKRLETFTIVTTEPNALCAPIHNRMPAIIDPADFPAWLTAAPGSASLLRPFPAERMAAYKVGPAVGSVRNKGPELIEPLPA